MTSPGPEHLQLLLAWRRGDDDAGEALFRVLEGPIYRFFLNKVCGDDPADLMQSTFLRLLDISEERLLQIADFRGYLYGVARHVFHDYLEKKAKRARVTLDFTTTCLTTLVPRTQSSIVHARRNLQAFVNGLRALPLDDQILLELKYIEGLSAEAVGEILDIPASARNGRLQRARQRLVQTVTHCLQSPGKPAPSAIDADTLDAWAAEIRAQLPRSPQ
jgi:RNA polymerase sigma-70 factor (ECF subfamily)